MTDDRQMVNSFSYILKIHSRFKGAMSVPLIQDCPIREFADEGKSCEKYIYLNDSALPDTYYVLHFELIVTEMHLILISKV